ncbi:acyl-CoA dehydrogenase family protein [Sphingopyxis macrogoltabida]|uniref:acyl-CoA dehydrogenase family protein n=1 Tax=Sphingopyxis macrogoltabida TaxID=33050 RepID=UPI0006CA6201|nr:acyl-CoA dehydrogenase family protein [Sphingopyxis macrogoltabida]
MDLTPNDEQIALQTATADWCSDHMPLVGARSRSAGLWQQLDTMGWTGMTAPEMGLDHATETLLFAELGRFLAPVALLSTAVAARWTGAAGKAALALPAQEHVRILDGVEASRALGAFGDGLACFPLAGQLSSTSSLDQSTPLARIVCPAEIEPVDDPRALLHLQLLTAAYAVGCADAARDMAADYAKLRQQFDRPIGWFQALKHLCSDMAVRAAVARSQLYYAACALDADDIDAAFHIAAAKRLADQAALDNGRANIQVHGGIGMTDEAHPHLCLKRAHLLQFIVPAETAALLAA